MRPLKLTIYPPIHRPRYSHGIDPYRKLIESKRLAEAELAAEVFSAVFHEAECELRGRKIALRFGNDHPAVDHYAGKNHEFGRQAEILERFATLPHYDEEPQP